MLVGSVCSGVGTCRLASQHLGWSHAFFAEVDPFASALLAHRFPDVPNLGDMMEITADAGPVDILVGGTPCQSFSVAGLRAGLADPRGNLALGFLRLAQDLRARWLVWENVPGVLSSNGGRDFGAILGALEELGYGWAYRVLDARHFGVPQRRRRVFLVGHLGGCAGPGAVLFEPEGLRGDSAPGFGLGTSVAAANEGSTGKSRALVIASADGANADPLTASDGPGNYCKAGNNPRPHNVVFGQTGPRRLTPRECERLQGLPDDWTLIPWRWIPGAGGDWEDAGPPRMAADGPRYRAIGNGWALPVARWVFERIDAVDAATTREEKAP
jgi:DNA (cytosine-5)-methyltransferase 1